MKKRIIILMVGVSTICASSCSKWVPISSLKPETLKIIHHSPELVQFGLSDNLDLIADTSSFEASVDEKGRLIEKTQNGNYEIFVKKHRPGVCVKKEFKKEGQRQIMSFTPTDAYTIPFITLLTVAEGDTTWANRIFFGSNQERWWWVKSGL